MKKSTKSTFVLFGVLSSHCLFYLGAMIVASFVWGAYFKRFYDIQDKQPAWESAQEPGKEEYDG